MRDYVVNFFIAIFLIFCLAFLAKEGKYRFFATFENEPEYAESNIGLYRVEYSNAEIEINKNAIYSFVNNDPINTNAPRFEIVQQVENFDENYENQYPPESDSQIADDILKNPVLSSHLVQLGIFTNRENVDDALQKLKEMPIFQGYDFFVDSNKTKTLYYLQLGNFSTKIDALNFCRSISNIQPKCFVVNY